MEHAYDIVDILLVDREPGVLCFGAKAAASSSVSSQFNCHNIFPVGHNIFCVLIHEENTLRIILYSISRILPSCSPSLRLPEPLF